MKISIIIPSYKPKSYIYECLDSLVEQTLSKELWEVVLVINGCNEPYYSNLLNKYSSSLPNLTMIQVDTAGVSNARNIGIINSTGEYITFIDDDDFVSNNFLEELYSKAHCDGITISNILTFLDRKGDYNFEEFNRTKTFLLLRDKEQVNIYDARKLLNGPWIKLIPKSVIRNSKFDVRLKNGEDAVFMFEISKNIKDINFTDPSAVYYIRQRSESASSKKLPLSYWVKTAFAMDYILSRAFFLHMHQYSFRFFMSRLMAPWKKVLKKIVNN